MEYPANSTRRLGKRQMGFFGLFQHIVAEGNSVIDTNDTGVDAFYNRTCEPTRKRERSVSSRDANDNCEPDETCRFIRLDVPKF